MIISGKHIVEMGIVTNLADPKCQIQPAGIDFTLGRLSTLKSAGVLDFDNTRRKLPEYEQVKFDAEGKVHLKPGAYLVEFNETVKMPVNLMAMLQTRSSVFRSGATLIAGVLDPGYQGVCGALLQVWNEHGISLYHNAKLAQWVFVEISNPSGDSYRGVYSGADSMFKPI